MRLNYWLYGILIVVLFMGTIGGAKAAGVWSVSGKLTGGGEQVVPTAGNPDDIKGWMTLDQISSAYGIPVAKMLEAFKLPAGTPGTTAVKELESATFSTDGLRIWIKEQLPK